MYHALDRANQRAVLQEQPHVSNYISGKGQKDGAGGGGVAVARTFASLPRIGAAGAAAIAYGQSSSEKFASSAGDAEEEGAPDNATNAAAAVDLCAMYTCVQLHW